VDIFKSLLPDDNTFKISDKHSQNDQVDTTNVVTTKKCLKFGNSVTAEWMTNDHFSTSDATEGDE